MMTLVCQKCGTRFVGELMSSESLKGVLRLYLADDPVDHRLTQGFSSVELLRCPGVCRGTLVEVKNVPAAE